VIVVYQSFKENKKIIHISKYKIERKEYRQPNSNISDAKIKLMKIVKPPGLFCHLEMIAFLTLSS